MSEEEKLMSICTTNHMEAQVMKSHLESKGIPVFLKYESAGIIYGITVDGLGETNIMVPAHLAQDAKIILGLEDE